MEEKILDTEWNFPVDNKNRLNFSMILIAKRRSGKTELVRYLYENYWWDKYDLVVVYTIGTTGMYYKSFIKGQALIQEKVDLQEIRLMMARNEKRMKRGKAPINILAIFDDTNTRKQKFDDDLLDVYTKGRHSNISIVYCTQAPTLVDNIWKENSDLIVIFKMKTMRYLEYVAESIVSGILDKEFESRGKERRFYINLIKRLTKEKYRAIVLDLVDDQITSFKAPLDR